MNIGAIGKKLGQLVIVILIVSFGTLRAGITDPRRSRCLRSR